MLKLKALEELGKPYAIFTDQVESGAIEQFVNVMKLPDVIQGALMPDVHSGYVMPIGGVVLTQGTIYPSFVGYDIGCGVCTIEIDFKGKEINFEEIRDKIYEVIPVGFNVHKDLIQMDVIYGQIGTPPKAIQEIVEKHANQYGTLGGGNHFIEVGISKLTGKHYISIHSGSRGLGHRVATKYMELAAKLGDGKLESANGFDVNTELGQAYIDAMRYCNDWALINRESMLHHIGRAIGGELKWDTLINNTHNHARSWGDGRWLHRKGATDSDLDEMAVIPANMRDGVFVVKGKGNADSMLSSSHGCGRLLSRSKAKKKFDLEAFQQMFGNLDTSGFTIDVSRIDECPEAYKNYEEVMYNQRDLIEIVDHILPIVNVKG